MPNSIKQILMTRDNMTSSNADDLIQQAFEAFYDYLASDEPENAENVCSEYFGLEPNYLEKLIDI